MTETTASSGRLLALPVLFETVEDLALGDNGDLLIYTLPSTGTMDADELARFSTKWIYSIDGSGCWLWIAQRDQGGYGRFWLSGHSRGAHRVSYEHYVDLVPDGYTVDHRCGNRGCVNPAHLHPETNRSNVLLGDTLPAANAAKTTCPEGHKFDGLNLYRHPDGSRKCRLCRERDRRAYDLRFNAIEVDGQEHLQIEVEKTVTEARPTTGDAC